MRESKHKLPMHQGPASGTQRSYSEVLRDAPICSFGFGKSRLAAAWAYQPLCQRAAPPDLMQRALCSHSCTCWLWNVMMKSTNNQTPRSEGWLFYPLSLMWSVANCLNCFFFWTHCVMQLPWFSVDMRVIGWPRVPHSSSYLLLS